MSFRVITKSAPVFALAVATIFIYFGLPRTAPADLISVDWDNSDSTADGLINGNLGSVNVSVNNQTSLLSPTGGQLFTTNWATNLSSNNVPGIADPGVLSEAATIDWNLGDSVGATSVTFSEAVTDPIFLFNFPDSSAHEFIFYSNTIERLVLDWNLTNPNFPFGNNTIQINASEGNNTADSGFSIKLLGNYSDVSFDILIDGGSAADASSYGFTVLTAVPEPSSLLLLAGLVCGTGFIRRR